ncbi:MAG TPA: GDSL-type esterase/lipase family protein [Capsulimonadaceae bacterium]
MKLVRLLLTLCLSVIAIAPGVANAVTGDDLLPVFQRSHAGAPLRAVYIGGSITQAGNGWAREWLVSQFPKSAVTIVNAGMSATGSDLGIFRLSRDVIACQPDIVFVEFAVNDGGQSDEQATRCLETIVVRLKSLPHPPAVVFLETAAKEGSNRKRHQAVAKRYGLLDVDFQVALDAHLAKTKQDWGALMGDSVHPNEAGHAFYSDVVAKALQPFVEAAKTSTELAGSIQRLPSPLTKKPLWLDANIAAIPTTATWRKENSIPFWWDMFFLGVTGCNTPGQTLTIPFRGTAVGLFYALDPSYGALYASLDGGPPRVIVCNNRGGYSYTLLGTDLKPQQHLLTVCIPSSGPANNMRTVKLGYLMVAGETKATDALAPQGPFTPDALAKFAVVPVPAKTWRMAGPFGGSKPTLESIADLDTLFAPEEKGNAGAWVPAVGAAEWVDIGKATGMSDRSVSYARARLRVDMAQTISLLFSVDYFAKIWVNGALVKAIRDGHGGVTEPVVFPVALNSGWNDVLVKVHSGSKGNGFALSISPPDGGFEWGQ